MLFNSFEFLIFFIAVVAIFFALPERRRWILLLAASYYFYMSWKAEYVVLIIAATLINYAVGIGLERSKSVKLRRTLLTAGITSSLGILFTFKYLDFISTNVQQALEAINIFHAMPAFDLLLPLGISFYTFQAIGYAIDVYRGDTPAERHLGIFALYVSFFPQLVAGPIERSHRLLPQFRRASHFQPERVASGMQLILWGLIKKVVIADRLAVVVDIVYRNPDAYSGLILILATVFFSVQIYCDFSGYSDMAIGTARIMGYDLMTNFRRPYFANSMADFWRRWHISLSTWFRDYLYKPLGGNRVSRPLWIRNILAVFLLSGLWHGANWTFVAWGAIHGLALIGGSLSMGIRTRFVEAIGLLRWPRVHHAVKVGTVILITGSAWVFFRAQTLEDAITILAGFFDMSSFSVATLWSLGLTRFEMATALASLLLLFSVEAVQEFSPRSALRLWSFRGMRWALYLAAFYGIVFFGVFGNLEFIYFQF
jgi:D-alanyl-lipoteichoic acid acyltransferase DltB (MBOAT superfamily)